MVPASGGWLRAPQVPDQAPGGHLNQIQHVLEAVRSAVVRVWNVGDACVRRELEEEPQAVLCLRRRAALQCAQVLAIHGEYEIEVLEIARLDHARAQRREVITASRRGFPRPPVGKLAHVVAGRSGRVDFQHDVRCLAGRDRPKHDFRGRRAADIAETDEKDPHSPAILRCNRGLPGKH